VRVESCPQCGAPSESSVPRCIYCRAEFVIISTSQLASLERPAVEKYIQFYRKAAGDDGTGEASMALGLCYLKLRLYDMAAAQFKKTIETAPERAEAHLYTACALAKGRKLKTVPSKEMPDIEAFVGAALMLAPDEPRALALQAAIKNDYYAANGMRVPPPQPSELLGRLRSTGAKRQHVDEVLDLTPLSDTGFAQSLRSAAVAV